MTEASSPYFPTISPGDEGTAVTFGRTYEQFHVGQKLKHGPGRTIDQGTHRLFCALTGNQHPLHSDENYVELKTDLKRIVVVGNWVFDVIFGMSVQDVSGKAIFNLEVTFTLKKPSFEGDTLYAETDVLEMRLTSNPSRGIVKVRTTGTNQRGEVVCVIERSVMVPAKAAA